MPGPPPKPTEKKKQGGNPGKGKLNENEPKPKGEIGNPPEWLNSIAKSEWEDKKRTAYWLKAIDGETLSIWCYLTSQIVELAKDIYKEGRITVTQKVDPLGNEVLEERSKPKTRQLMEIIKERRMVGASLGFDPANRSRINVSEKPKENEFQDFLDRKLKAVK